MKLLHRLIYLFHRFEDAVLALIFAGFVGLAFTQIVMRNVSGGGFVWGDSALRVLVFWLAMWGAMIAGRSEKHLRIEIAVHYLPKAWYHWCLVVCDFACAVISGIVAWYSLSFVIEERSGGAFAFAQLPAWWCESIIPVTFSLLALRYFSQAVLSLLRDEETIA